MRADFFRRFSFRLVPKKYMRNLLKNQRKKGELSRFLELTIYSAYQTFLSPGL